MSNDKQTILNVVGLSETVEPIDSFKPTMELRWLCLHANPPTLQQAWIGINTGKVVWHTIESADQTTQTKGD